MADFHADENFYGPTVRQLRIRGHDVLTAADAGRAHQRIPDDEVLRFAARQRRILLTLDLDFLEVQQGQPEHAGILLCQPTMDYLGLARRIDALVRTHPELSGHLVRLFEHRAPVWLPAAYEGDAS